MHKLPNLYRNRLGTYYLRITIAGREIKRSLGTKEPAVAKKAALTFALAKLGGSISMPPQGGAPGRQPNPPLTTRSDTTGNTFMATPPNEFFPDADGFRATTSNEDPMLTIPKAFTKFEVLMPNGIKLLGINDDGWQQSAVRSSGAAACTCHRRRYRRCHRPRA